MSYIIEQKRKNSTYVYKTASVWDKINKRSRQVRKYLGRRDNKTGEIISSFSRFNPKACKDYGNIFFLYQLAIRSGVVEILKKIFPDRWNEILTITFFGVSEKKPMYLCNSWLESNYSDIVESLSSQRISELFSYLGNETTKRFEFSKLWAQKQKDNKFVSIDLTSISSYSKIIESVEWGYNRDKEKIPQINLAFIFAQPSSLPIFYNVYRGSIKDVSTLNNILEFVKYLKLKNFTFVLDKGFWSIKNIIEIQKIKESYIIPLPFSTNESEFLVNKHAKDITEIKNILKVNSDILYCKKDKIKFGKHRCNVYVYFNENKMHEKKNQLMKELLDIEDRIKILKLTSKKQLQKELPEVAKKYLKYFHIKKTEKGFVVEKNNEEIIASMKNVGYFIVVTNHDQDAGKLILYYRDRDAIEKLFDDWKNELDIKRLKVHTEITMEGRIFIGYLESILYSLISKIMKEENLFNRYTIEEVFTELKKLKVIQLDSKNILCEISKKQKEIFKAFKINLPINKL